MAPVQQSPDLSAPLPSATAPEGDTASQRYWKSLNGLLYREMISGREREGNRNYRQQEAFLSAFFAALRRARGQDLRVLEFGCGFGRHAQYLGPMEGIRYHGYDFSEEMVKPLRANPPPSLEPLERHLFVGPRVSDVVGDMRFDVVFTVSVLIHNPPEVVRRLLAEMGSLLRPDGIVCLVENQAVPLNVFENAWHDGCWLHSYPTLADDFEDVYLAHGPIDLHDVYVLRPGRAKRRWFIAGPAERLFEDAREVGERDFVLCGMEKLRKWAAGLPGPGANAAPERTAALEEESRLLRAQLDRRDRIDRLVADLRTIRRDASSPEPEPTQEAGTGAWAVRRPIAINDPLDTEWAQVNDRFDEVAHLFNQEYLGIRAAAGYMPGKKIGVSHEGLLPEGGVREVLEYLQGAGSRHLLFHGYSKNLEEMACLVRKAFGRAVRLYWVWHGNTAQFHHSVELRSVERLIRLKRRGVIDRMAFAKPHMAQLSSEFFQRTILNPCPRVQTPGVKGAATRAALVPVPNDWRKNLYTNVYAAAAAKGIDRIHVSAPFARVPSFEHGKRITVHAPLSRRQMFALLGHVDLVLNATLSECQPLTAVEALAHDVPCVTGPLDNGALDEHPLQKLTQVAAVDSLGAVRAAIERILRFQAQHPSELQLMLSDYRSVICGEAFARYLELFSG